MNYLAIYDQLINKRKLYPLKDIEYGEYHHIVPRCLGGGNEKENLIKLTAKEHYVAHHLLYKHYRTSKLAHAWFSMLRCDPNQKRFFTARMHEAAKIAHINALKESMKGEGNHFYGRKHTEETKATISRKNKGRVKSQDEIDNWIEKVAKLPKSEEHRKKIGRKGLITLKNKDTGETVRIPVKDIDNYDRSIWLNPAAVSQKREKCAYCGIESTVGNITRWHNEKCKHRRTS